MLSVIYLVVLFFHFIKNNKISRAIRHCDFKLIRGCNQTCYSSNEKKMDHFRKYVYYHKY